MRQTSCGEDYLARPIRIVPAQGRGVDEIPTRGPAPTRFRGVRVARLARFRAGRSGLRRDERPGQPAFRVASEQRLPLRGLGSVRILSQEVLGHQLRQRCPPRQWRKGRSGRIAAGQYGGGCEIRTREGLPPTRFPTRSAAIRRVPLPSVSCADSFWAAVGERLRTGVNETRSEPRPRSAVVLDGTERGRNCRHRGCAAIRATCDPKSRILPAEYGGWQAFQLG
jgi:hypothetical protein